jgi:nucleoside-diphosphate-sugar epimerase
LTAGRWLITGASGFLGRHLLTHMENEAAAPELLALVRNQAEWETMEWTRALHRVQTVPGAITEPEVWKDDPRLTGLAGIFHLAALVRHTRRHSDEVYHTNVVGTSNMVRLAARHRCRVIFVSTSGTVGCFRRSQDSADEDATYCEREVSDWPYYHSKIQAEREARRIAGELGVELVIVRPPVLLGPGDHRFRSTGHLIRFLRGKLPFLVQGGMHYADVRDVARALVRAMMLKNPRPVYHLPGTSCSIEDFFADAAVAAGLAPPSRVISSRLAWWLARLTAPLHLLPDPVVVEMASRYWGLTSRYAEPELGYRSRPGQETLRDTVEWLRMNHPLLLASGRQGASIP